MKKCDGGRMIEFSTRSKNFYYSDNIFEVFAVAAATTSHLVTPSSEMDITAFGDFHATTSHHHH